MIKKCPDYFLYNAQPRARVQMSLKILFFLILSEESSILLTIVMTFRYEKALMSGYGFRFCRAILSQ